MSMSMPSNACLQTFYFTIGFFGGQGDNIIILEFPDKRL